VRTTARFCGAGALSAADRDDYAAFMRVAFRSALQRDVDDPQPRLPLRQPIWRLP
jgi:hypothetical protein